MNVSCSQFQAINVKQAIWDSGWVGAPIWQQRNIVFMMAAANEDFALTAGGFAPLSLRTMIVVRNTEHSVSQCVTSQEICASNDMEIMCYSPVVLNRRAAARPGRSLTTAITCFIICTLLNVIGIIQQNGGEMGEHTAYLCR
jgi:hypothetical protein